MTNPPTNRLRGGLPKVGIRPTIDGRYGGVRESLEGVTMGMAQRTAELISRELRHATGHPVECVIADRCIGGFPEAADAAEKFAREGVGVSLTVTPCWCYGLETTDTEPTTPKAIWGFNGTDRPGAVYLAAALSGHNQSGVPCFGIYGRDVQDLGDETIPDDVQEKILRFVRAGLAVASMRGKSYLAMGGVPPGCGSVVDHGLGGTSGCASRRWTWPSSRGGSARGCSTRRSTVARWTGSSRTAWRGRTRTRGRSSGRAQQKRRGLADEREDAALIARDLMVGNQLEEDGLPEQAAGHNAIAGGFQGQRN